MNAMQDWIAPGVRVQTLQGELDSYIEAGQDIERVTSPGTWGVLASLNHIDGEGLSHWDVTFEGGGWVILSTAELSDPTAYKLGQPATAAECARWLKYGYEVRELTMYDDRMIGVAEQLTNCADEILALVAELETLREQRAAKASA